MNAQIPHVAFTNAIPSTTFTTIAGRGTENEIAQPEPPHLALDNKKKNYIRIEGPANDKTRSTIRNTHKTSKIQHLQGATNCTAVHTHRCWQCSRWAVIRRV